MSRVAMTDGMKVLFQGDSITDAGRTGSTNRDEALGGGYAAVIAARLAPRGANVTVINRGISGHRIYDLEARWTRDCIDLQPDVLSILIGINDTWRRYDSDMLSPIAKFEDCYRRMLDRVRAETQAQIVILEPFVLPTPADRAGWREDLDPRIHAVRRVACDYQAIFLPLDGLFAEAATREPMESWLPDGVHPSEAGHKLIADAWLNAVFGE